jgi:hypothetical protein
VESDPAQTANGAASTPQSLLGCFVVPLQGRNEGMGNNDRTALPDSQGAGQFPGRCPGLICGAPTGPQASRSRSYREFTMAEGVVEVSGRFSQKNRKKS